MRKRKLVIGLVVALLFVGAVVGGGVLAQSPTPTPTPGIAGWGRGLLGRMGAMFGKMWGGRGGDQTLIGAVAKALDLTVADVTAELNQGKTLREVIVAHKGDADAIVKAWLEARKTAFDQAQQELQKQANAQLDQKGSAQGIGRWGEATLVGAAAKALNLPVTDLVAELNKGQTLREVITAHNGNVDAIGKSVLDARKAELDQAVANKRLTQDQANQMLDNMQKQLDAELDQKGLTPGMGRGMGQGMGRGHMAPGSGGQGPTGRMSRGWGSRS